MCGICGVIDLTQKDLKQQLEKMVKSLHHRGPDDRGIEIFENNRVALGHTRLSIHDLSAEGHQPMSSPSARYTVVYNGEIYNFLELKRQLKL